MEQSTQYDIFIDFGKPETAERFSSPEELDEYKNAHFHIIVGEIPAKLRKSTNDQKEAP